MAQTTSKTRFPGVYTRESTKRRHAGKPDVVYYYCVHKKGKRIWIKCGWRSEGMTAQAAHAMRSRALLEGRGAAQPLTMTVAEMFDAYFPTQANNAKASRRLTEICYRLYILPVLGAFRLDEVSDVDLLRMHDMLRNQGKSASTITAAFRCLFAGWRATQRMCLHNVNPPSKQALPRIKMTSRIRYLNKDEAVSLMRVLSQRSPIWADIAALSLLTGARIGELLSLTPVAIHLDSRTADVIGKTGRRSLQLNAQACNILARRMAGKHATETIFGVHPRSSTFSRVVNGLGLNPPGTPREQRVVFHTLRHTFASWLAIDGVPLYTISKLMGHSSIRMTERYAHLCPDGQKSAVDRLTLHFTPPCDDEPPASD